MLPQLSLVIHAEKPMLAYVSYIHPSSPRTPRQSENWTLQYALHDRTGAPHCIHLWCRSIFGVFGKREWRRTSVETRKKPELLRNSDTVSTRTIQSRRFE